MNASNDKLSTISSLSNMLMLLTSIHHVYGAVLYHTPYRLHILFLSLPVLALTIALNKLLKTFHSGKFRWLFHVYAAMIVVCSILLIGFYEGVYNHIFKNIAYWGGMPAQKLDMFFPPDIYVMPNDFFFELTGIGQGILAVWLFIRFVKLFTIG